MTHARMKAYLFAFLGLVLAIWLRWLLEPILGGEYPLVTLFGAVAVGVWLGGYPLGGAVAAIGFLACAYLFIEPRGTFGFGELRSFVAFIAYVMTCSVIIGFGEAMRVAHWRADLRRETLRVTLASMGDAVITADNQGQITSLNAVAESLTGWTEQGAKGHPLESVFRIVQEGTRLPVENPAIRALREGVIVGLANHTILIRKDGSERPIDDSAAPIKDRDGVIVGCVLIFRDITQRRALERQVEEQLNAARVLASIVESSDDAIVSKSLEGIIQSWNSAAERIFGYAAKDAVGRHISLIIPPERLKEEDQIIARIRAGDRIDHLDTVRVRKDGTRISISVTVSPIRDSEGRVIGASKIARDITDRKLFETDRQRLASLVENSTDFIGICDLRFLPIFVNRAGLDLVGLDDLVQARQTPVRDFFFPEDQPRIFEEFFPAVMKNGDGEAEIRFRHFKTGAAIWLLYRVFVLINPDGERIGFATVSRDITQRRQMEDDLRKLAADLSEANHRKDEFLAILAHELRNPLAPISNSLQILRFSISADGKEQSAFEMIERQVQQMVRLIDDLLDVSRITRGKIELKCERVELVSLVGHTAEAGRPQCESMRHQMIVTLPTAPLFVNGDPIRIAQIVGNLLTNACKFTDPGGRIWVTLESIEKHGLIRIRDTGAGIASEQLKRIFQMFTQVDSTLERSQGGLGIGLSLAKTLVEMHGGTITVHSEGVGRGAEFVVRLPLIEEGGAQSSSTHGEVNFGLSARRILVVDDNRDSAESLAMLLRLVGNEVQTAHDGVVAVELAQQLRPDVILLDIGLPRLNGYEVCRKIRDQTWGKSVIMIALTGWGQDEDRKKSKDAGFNGHLVKPVEHAALSKLLSELVPTA